jgi:hypothetical protein
VQLHKDAVLAPAPGLEKTRFFLKSPAQWFFFWFFGFLGFLGGFLVFGFFFIYLPGRESF